MVKCAMKSIYIAHTLAGGVRAQRREAGARGKTGEGNVRDEGGEGKGSFCDRGTLPISISQMSLLGDPPCGAFLLLMVAVTIYVSLK